MLLLHKIRKIAPIFKLENLLVLTFARLFKICVVNISLINIRSKNKQRGSV